MYLIKRYRQLKQNFIFGVYKWFVQVFMRLAFLFVRKLFYQIPMLREETYNNIRFGLTLCNPLCSFRDQYYLYSQTFRYYSKGMLSILIPMLVDLSGPWPWFVHDEFPIITWLSLCHDVSRYYINFMIFLNSDI